MNYRRNFPCFGISTEKKNASSFWDLLFIGIDAPSKGRRKVLRKRNAERPFRIWRMVFAFLLCSVITWQILTRRARVKVTFVTSLWKYEGTFEQCSQDHAAYAAVDHWTKTFDETIILADAVEVCVALRPLRKKSLKCIPHDCKHPTDGKPIVRCLLQRGIDLASHDHIMFSNSDLVYKGVPDAIKISRKRFSEFVILGQRYDIDFKGFCESKINLRAAGSTPSLNSKSLETVSGRLHGPYGIDYLAFPKDTRIPLHRMPDFLIGIWKWDNWIVDNMIKSDINVIDGTQAIRAIHLQSTLGVHKGRSGADHNKAAYMEFYNLTAPNHLLDDPFPVGLGSIDFCPFRIHERKIKRRWCYLNLLPGDGTRQPLCDDP